LHQQTTLPNGLTILTVPMPGVETAAIGLHLDVGSRHEPARVNGVAHMIEHMVFKGTQRRSAKRIAEEIEDVGGQLNAYTARDTTVFHARVLADDVALAVDMISDLVCAPVLDAAELEKEREVVLQELGEARDTPDDIIHDHLQAVAYAGQPIGRSVRTICAAGWNGIIPAGRRCSSARARWSTARWSIWRASIWAICPAASARRLSQRASPGARTRRDASWSRRI